MDHPVPPIMQSHAEKFLGARQAEHGTSVVRSVKYPFYKKHRVSRHVWDEEEGKANTDTQ